MNFSSLLFLYIYLPLILLVYFAMPDVRRKNIVLVAASFLLYSMGQPLYVLLLAGLSSLNFWFSIRIRPKEFQTLYLPLAVNIAVFVIFGYVDDLMTLVGIGAESGGFLLQIIRKLVAGLNALGMNLAEPQTLLPVGLPFYFLTVVSYFFDIYSGKTKAEKNYLALLTYLTMFPKLAQGPIVRYEQVSKQLTGRKVNPRMIFEGMVRFVLGLSKKVLLADYCARFISGLADGADQTLVGAWLCALLYMYRIYFDFSGCCDMAIGLGRIFGFRFPDNFDYPHAAVSVTEFTRQWNLTLRAFLKDYVYLPLGGNRYGQIRQAINCLIVWILMGVWHGGRLNYVVWAVYLFVFVMAEKFLETQLIDLPRALRRFLTTLVILFGWVFFAHEDLMELGVALKGLLGFGGFALPGTGRTLLNSLPLIFTCILASGRIPSQIVRVYAHVCQMGGKQRKNDTITIPKAVYAASVFGFICVLLWLCSVSLTVHGSVPPIFGGI